MIDPTPRQVRALYEVHCFTGVYGRPPTYRELASMLGVRLYAAQKHIHYAEKKGLNRGLALTTAGLAAVHLLQGG